MTKTLIGPEGIRIVLDSREIVPNDPGAGTPAMVYVGAHSGTFWCALDTGEIDGGDYTLSDRQFRWLDDQFDSVDAFMEQHG